MALLPTLIVPPLTLYLQHYFKSQVCGLDLHHRYVEHKEPVKVWIDGNFAEINRAQGVKGRINEIVKRVRWIEDYIKEFAANNDAFKAKVDEFFQHQTQQEQLDSLVYPALADNKEALKSIIASWEEKLKNFEYADQNGKFLPQNVLYSEIAELKVTFKQKCGNLKAALQNRLQQDVTTLAAKAQNLQVIQESEIAQKKEQLVQDIKALLDATINISAPEALDYKNLQRFITEYDRLANNLASLEQGLTRKQFIAQLYNDNVVKTVTDIDAKIEKLEKVGNETATNKAIKLWQIKEQVSTIKEKMDRSNDQAEIKQAIDAAKATIEQNKPDISVYRSQWGSKFIFGIFGKKYLESRVTSQGLINALSDQLDNFALQLEERPPVAQSSI